MKYIQKIIIFTLSSFYLFFAISAVSAQQATPADLEEVERTNLPPLMERYILDELKSLRSEMERNKTELVEKVVDRDVHIAEEALTYSINTVTYFFYIITGVGVILAIIGWNSIRDIKTNLHDIADKEIRRLTKEYEKRLTIVEKDLREKSEEILINQQEIEKTQKVHFLWWQGDTEQDDNKKILLYNQILELNPDAAEAYVRRSNAHLRLGNFQEVVNSATKAIELVGDNSTAFYNRACALAQMGQKEEAILDLSQTFQLSESLKDHAEKDELLKPLHKLNKYKDLFK